MLYNFIMKTIKTKLSRAYKLSKISPKVSKQNIDKMDEILKNSCYAKSLCPDEFLNFAKYYINWLFETNGISPNLFDVKIKMTSQKEIEKVVGDCYAYAEYDYYTPMLTITLNKEYFVIDYQKKGSNIKLKRVFTDFAHECEHCVQRLNEFKTLMQKDCLEDFIENIKEFGLPKKMLNQKLFCQGYTNKCETDANQNAWVNLLYLIYIFKQNNPNNEEYQNFLSLLEYEIYKDKKIYKITTYRANLIEKRIDKKIKKTYKIDFSKLKVL